MSVRYVAIFCDRTGCPSYCQTRAVDVAGAREQAAGRGWTAAPDGRDLCGYHKEEE